MDPLSYSRSSQCPTTSATKDVVCAILSFGMVYIKQTFLLIGKSSPCSGGSGFPLSLSDYSFTIICPTPYNRIYNITATSITTSIIITTNTSTITTSSTTTSTIIIITTNTSLLLL